MKFVIFYSCKKSLKNLLIYNLTLMRERNFKSILFILKELLSYYLCHQI